MSSSHDQRTYGPELYGLTETDLQGETTIFTPDTFAAELTRRCLTELAHSIADSEDEPFDMEELSYILYSVYEKLETTVLVFNIDPEGGTDPGTVDQQLTEFATENPGMRILLNNPTLLLSDIGVARNGWIQAFSAAEEIEAVFPEDILVTDGQSTEMAVPMELLVPLFVRSVYGLMTRPGFGDTDDEPRGLALSDVEEQVERIFRRDISIAATLSSLAPEVPRGHLRTIDSSHGIPEVVDMPVSEIKRLILERAVRRFVHPVGTQAHEFRTGTSSILRSIAERVADMRYLTGETWYEGKPGYVLNQGGLTGPLIPEGMRVEIARFAARLEEVILRYGVLSEDMKAIEQELDV